MKKEIKARIQELIGTSLSHEQLLEKIASLNDNNQRLDAILAIVYGEFTFPNSQEIKGMIKQCSGIMHDRMLYTTLKKYYEQIKLNTKTIDPSQQTIRGVDYSQPTA